MLAFCNLQRIWGRVASAEQHRTDLPRLAKFLSAVLNAPVAAAYAFAILVVSEDTPHPLTILFVSIFFATVVVLITLYVLARTRVTSDFYASNRETRLIPFAIAVASFAFGVLALLFLQAPKPIIALMLSLLVNNGILALITLRWKISIHANGIAGPATVLAYSLGSTGYLFALLIIPVVWARMALKAHTAGQLLAGALLAPLVTYVLLRIYLPLV